MNFVTVRKRFLTNCFPVQADARIRAADVRSVRERSAVLTIDEEMNVLYGVKLRERPDDGGAHIFFLLFILRVQNLCAHVYAGVSAGNIEVKRRPFRHDGDKSQPRGVHVVSRVLHHQLQRGLRDAVLTHDAALHGHQIAVSVLVIDNGFSGIRRLCA